jgi:hypothetical protein
MNRHGSWQRLRHGRREKLGHVAFQLEIPMCAAILSESIEFPARKAAISIQVKRSALACFFLCSGRFDP